MRITGTRCSLHSISSGTIAIILLSAYGLANYSYQPNCLNAVHGYFFDHSEHVFHGKVASKSYLMFDQHTAIVTFDVIESFKGDTGKQISLVVDEYHDLPLASGFDYVIFAYREGFYLKTDNNRRDCSKCGCGLFNRLAVQRSFGGRR